jgi:lipid-A-disaccharide synthase
LVVEGQGQQGAGIKIFLIAGEPSGDILGARLMAGIKRATKPSVQFVGVGGERMEKEGLETLFPMTELSVMGVAEIVPHLPRLLRRISETARAIRDVEPDMIVTIDAPAFCFRVLKRLRNLAIIKVHYVAPTVWAWRPWRARKIAPLVDHLMVLLPFEPPYFDAVGLSTTFVGHPVLESDTGKADVMEFRLAHNIAPEVPLLCLLPGSRRGELAKLLPPFKEAVQRLSLKFPDLRIVVPTLGGLAPALRAELQSWAMPIIVVEGERDKFNAMAAADVALAASGTVALELALMGVPNVIAYRVHPITAIIVSRLMKVKYVNLVNFLVDRPAVPEFLQVECRGDLLSDAVAHLLTDKDAADMQKTAMGDAMALLSSGTTAPSDKAAATVLELISNLDPATS